MPPQPYLDHAQIAAPPDCEAQARRFYGELVGLGELEKPGALRVDGLHWVDSPRADPAPVLSLPPRQGSYRIPGNAPPSISTLWPVM